MKHVVIVGPGGLGGIVAALLARQGRCQVTVIGRPGAQLDAIRGHGLRLEGREELTVRIDALETAQGVRDCNALLFAVKAQHTQAALASTRHIQVRDFVASLQNGVLKDDLLAGMFSHEKVLGALAVIAGQCTRPGVVNWTFDGGTQFGELDGEPSARAEWMVDVFQQSGLMAQSSNIILSAIWSKMIGWVPLGLLAALSGKSNAEVFSNRQLAEEYVGMVHELSALAASKDVSLIDIGPYHVKTWSQEDIAHAVRLVITSPLSGSQTTHSALQDIQRDSPTEFSACVGPMIEEANESSIPMKAIQARYTALMKLEQTL